MATKPPLPDGCDLPPEVNGWVHDPESNKNGHTWYGPDRESAVAVFASIDRVRVSVMDERVTGFARSQDIYEQDYDEDGQDQTGAEVEGYLDAKAEATGAGVEAAVEWMHDTAPAWHHPDVTDAAFDPPAGYTLDSYYLEQRETTIYYRHEGEEWNVRMAGVNDPRTREFEPDAVTIETHPYLVVHCWNGSGNATVAVAPWLCAHDHELVEVRETPEECGLEIALKLAREYAREDVVDTVPEMDDPPVGQAGLGRWSA